MITDAIENIINDFDKNNIPDFFDLKMYETEHELVRHFRKFLRIGYIKKDQVDRPKKAIYINFNKKYFWISGFPNSSMFEKSIFKDSYQNYDTIEDVYEKIVSICKNK